MIRTSWRLREFMISGWDDAGFTSFLIPTKVSRVRSFQIWLHFWCSLFTMIVKWWAWNSEGRNLKSSHTWLIWTITMLDGLGIHREWLSAREMTLLPASQDLWWPTTDLVIASSSIRSFQFHFFREVKHKIRYKKIPIEANFRWFRYLTFEIHIKRKRGDCCLSKAGLQFFALYEYLTFFIDAVAILVRVVRSWLKCGISSWVSCFFVIDLYDIGIWVVGTSRSQYKFAWNRTKPHLRFSWFIRS